MAKFTVRGKNIEITPALKDYVEKRVGKVDRFFEVGEVTVVLTVEKGQHIVEVTIPLGGMILRGEESTMDMYTSIDLVSEKLERQIEKYKAVENAGSTEMAFYVKGYVPLRVADEIKFEIERSYRAQMEIHEPDYENEDVPVLIENKSFAASTSLDAAFIVSMNIPKSLTIISFAIFLKLICQEM